MTVWTVSVKHIGTSSQCTAVATSFEGPLREKLVVRRGGLRRFFPKPLFKRSEPCPEVIVSCGFQAEQHVLKIKAAYGSKPLAVHLQPPAMEGYDLAFVSRHDWLEEYDARPGYHRMLGVPHRFSPGGWSGVRAAARARYAPDDERIVVVLVGGTNGAYAYDDASLANLVGSIRRLVGDGWKALVSVSRRTEQQTLDAVNTLRSDNVTVWGHEGENPYADYLAAADAFLVAKDSITMPCEALSTGKPVYALDLSKIPGPRLDKFERFHADMQDTLGLTRPYLGHLDPYDYTPPDEARRIAAVVKDVRAFRDQAFIRSGKI